MQQNILGTEIAKIRKELALTQKQLCEGICTQPTISLIENGSIIPSLEVLSQISIKLNKPLEYFTNILFFSNYDYLMKFVNDIEELTLAQNFKSVYQIVSKELASEPTDKWFQVFLKWQLSLSSYHLNLIDIDEALFDIKEIIKTTPKVILNKHFLDIRILNTLAFLFAFKKDYQNSIMYFNKISEIHILDDAPKITKHTYYLRIQYNKAKTLYDSGDYNAALKTCKEGIKQSIQQENMSLLGNFYYYLAQCYEQMNAEYEKISSLYKKALFIFEILNRHLYVKTIKKEKIKFL